MQLPIFDEAEAVPLLDSEAVDYRVERNIARAAEYLVAYDISRRGWDCFTVGEGLRYDLIADVRGLRRIQVKMNRRASYRAIGSVSQSYTFGNKHDLRDYAKDVDLFAFVAMDRSVVLYVTPDQIRRAQLHVSASGMTPEMSDLSWSQAVRTWGID